MTTRVGLLCAVGSALFNGSFTVPFKIAQARNRQDESVVASSAGGGGVHPIIFTLYCSLGVFLSSWLVAVPILLLLQRQHGFHDHDQSAVVLCSWWGVVAGWLFVLGVAASFVAIDRIGMALAQGIWAGSATVVSYIWGKVVFSETPRSPGLSILGLFLLVIGVVGIAGSQPIAKRFDGRRYTGSSESEPLVMNSSVDDSLNNHKYVTGVLWACSVGLFGGSILAPTHYLPPQQQGLAILPAFGIGAATLAPLVLVAYHFALEQQQHHDGNPWAALLERIQHSRPTLLPGLLSGALWNVSNVLSIWAIPVIGYAVAYPLLQAAVMVSGLWGIYIFREITDRSTVRVFWMGSAILLLGAAILAASQA